MKPRLTSAFFLVLFLFTWLFFTGEVLFTIISIGVIAWTLFEFFSAVKRCKAYRPFATIGIIGGVLIMSYQALLELAPDISDQTNQCIALVLFMIFASEIFRKEKQDSIANIALTVFGVFFLAFLGSYMIKIRFLPHARLWILFLFVVAKMNDVGAYVIGSRFGHVKLAKYISPKKTVEGAVGGVLIGVLSGLGLWLVLDEYHTFIGLTGVIGLSFILGIIGQLGDLFESLLKRDLKIKDFGHFIPGFGGVLDLLDSMYFATPALYFYITEVMRLN